MSAGKYNGGFRELEVWKKARVFRQEISALTKSFPTSEKYKLVDQLLRASRGISACIAEGTDDITIKRIFNFAGRHEVH